MAKLKSLTIYQESNPPITVLDEDERTKEQYAHDLSEFMRLTNISILETSHSAIIIKPSRINSIHIEEVEISSDEGDKQQERQVMKKKPVKKKPVKKPAKKPVTKKEEPVDIITDVD